MAVNLASEYFRDLKNIRIMLVGSGEGAALVAKALKQRWVNFAITSRTFERAKSFSDTVAGNPIPFENALDMLSEFDLIFVSTTAPYYLITCDRIQKAISKRNCPLMIFDLSNPRTVEEDIAALNQVKLVNIDQIAEIVEENLKTRKREVHNAEKIIEMEMKSVDNLLKRKQAEPIIISIFKNVDSIRERELQKAINMIGQKIGPEEYKIVEQLSYAIVEGILSAPMNNLRKELEIDDKNPEELVKIITKLFKYEIKH
jgi:glutamyl-tRNA reductase